MSHIELVVTPIEVHPSAFVHIERLLQAEEHRLTGLVGHIRVGRDPEAGDLEVHVDHDAVVRPGRVGDVEEALSGRAGRAEVGMKGDIEHAIFAAAVDDLLADVEER